MYPPSFCPLRILGGAWHPKGKENFFLYKQQKETKILLICSSVLGNFRSVVHLFFFFSFLHLGCRTLCSVSTWGSNSSVSFFFRESSPMYLMGYILGWGFCWLPLKNYYWNKQHFFFPREGGNLVIPNAFSPRIHPQNGTTVEGWC